MGLHAQNIAIACKFSRAYAERILDGIPANQFARKAVVNGTTIEANHPAWVFGHLANYPAKAAAMLGLDVAKFAAPANFEDLFKDGTPCQDDASGTIYPSMETITTVFFRTHDAIIEALAGVDDAKLILPTADEKARQRFPLTGGRLTFMCTSHIMMHMGQVSTWRRCMGMPAA